MREKRSWQQWRRRWKAEGGEEEAARLAGRSPAGVICAIMNPDGTMARLDDLIAFARQHRLKIGRICDLVAFRKTSGRHPQSGLSTAPRMYRSGLG